MSANVCLGFRNKVVVCERITNEVSPKNKKRAGVDARSRGGSDLLSFFLLLICYSSSYHGGGALARLDRCETDRKYAELRQTGRRQRGGRCVSNQGRHARGRARASKQASRDLDARVGAKACARPCAHCAKQSPKRRYYVMIEKQ